MKNLTRITLLVVGLAAVSFPGFSATAEPTATDQPGARAKMRAHVTKRLDLTADQKAQLKAKRSNTAAAVKALRADTSLTREEKRAKARELLQGARNDMRSVLTADQQSKLDKARAHVRKHRLGRRAL